MSSTRIHERNASAQARTLRLLSVYPMKMHGVGDSQVCAAALMCRGRPEKEALEKRLTVIANSMYLGLGWCVLVYEEGE